MPVGSDPHPGSEIAGFRVAPEQAVRLLEQVAAHEHGLIHRDVKPGNVLIARGSGRKRCYLADVGVTKQTSSISGLTRTGELVGTVNYVSPEQIRGEQVDGRSDVYAVGCVLCECLAGDPPFARETEVARLWAHVHEPPPPLAAARPELGEEIEAAAGPPNHANRLEATLRRDQRLGDEPHRRPRHLRADQHRHGHGRRLRRRDGDGLGYPNHPGRATAEDDPRRARPGCYRPSCPPIGVGDTRPHPPSGLGAPGQASYGRRA